MPKSRETRNMNKVRRYIDRKLDAAAAMYHDKQQDDATEPPGTMQLHVRDICADLSIKYQTLQNYGVYRTVEREYDALSYRRNKGSWRVDLHTAHANRCERCDDDS